ncbi:tRNA lysidine(34) synthetase TilS [Leucobacter musarum]|uniref:tRNA lysidine(34) synthetase TilS n=1 Tax=Leucobacter musarum TaxID=1930747 RepID=UPI0006A7DD9E|nr:tRNA lysidine(34) synthetase TilS [Leucobacter musarum]
MLQTDVLATRHAVRRALQAEFGALDAAANAANAPLVLVALSGGADSLALAAATAFVAPRAGLRAGAVIVDHGLQPGSADVASRAAQQAAELGLAPVVVRQANVEVVHARGDGPEAAARDARYAEFADALAETGASVLLTAHTRDDQAEQVLLGLARGSGARSLAGIPPRRTVGHRILLRPFLDESAEITRAVTVGACREEGLKAWQDPQNLDPRFTRVRVRTSVLPHLERELGPGVAAALARSADLAREDAEAFDVIIAEQIEEIVEHAEAGIAVSVRALAANPAALRHRIIRTVAMAEFGSELSREHTLAIAALVTDWRGQGPIEVPGITVTRSGGRIVYTRRVGSPRDRVAGTGGAVEE